MIDDIVLPGELIETEKEITFRKNILKQMEVGASSEAPSFLFLSHGGGQLRTKADDKGQKDIKFYHIAHKYFAAQEDRVVGIVTKRTMEYYELDIRADKKGLLNVLGFEGATKKSKPNLQVGDLIFCRVIQVPTHLSIKLTCTSLANKKEWSSGEALFGELKGGIEVVVPIFFAQFLAKNETFFDYFKKRISFEIVVGINGVVWVKTKSLKNMLIIQDFLKEAAYLSMNRALELLSERASQLEQ